ncbi:MAG: sensor histidine kinase [Sciscionella sp.]
MDRIGLRDAWLPALLAAIGVVEMVALHGPAWGTGAVVEVVACALLTLRRRHGVVAPTAAMLLTLLLPVVGTPLDKPTLPIAVVALSFFSLARYVADLRGMGGFMLVLAATFVDYRWFDNRHHNWSDVIFVLTLAVPPYVVGRITRRLADQTVELAAAHEVVRAQAIREERARIARELHDVIAHSLSAMVVQTAAAQDLLRSDPNRAEEVLDQVASTGRSALHETGQLLHVLRDDENELGLQPTPGLAQLPALVEKFHADGLTVNLDVAAPLPALAAGLDVSVYRIAQEALTNALRYGVDRRAALAVSCVDGSLRIHVTNQADGRTGGGSGLGLLGMAERVSLLGGQLTHGISQGSFELDARLPVAP